MDDAEAARQRAWLPKAAKGCWDGIEGSWLGKNRRSTDWTQFTLRIERAFPGSERLRGEIIGLNWQAGAGATHQPKCVGGTPVTTRAYQHASGRFDDGYLEFDAYDVYKQEDLCGVDSRTYYPDKITGFVQENGIEMYGYNDDNVNQAHAILFIRTECMPMPAVLKPLLDLF